MAATDMVALYAELAPAFIAYLEREKATIQQEIARFKEVGTPTPQPNTGVV